MPQRTTKSLEDLDQHILADSQRRDPQQLAHLRQRLFSIIGLVLVVLGMIMFIIGGLEARKLINNRQWPITSADYTGGWLTTSSNGSILGSRYCLRPEFSYEVNGHSYSASSIASECSNFRDAIDEYEASYASAPVTLWYDPSDPSIISHHRIGVERPLIIWGVSAALVVFSAGFIFFALRQSAEKLKVVRKAVRPARPL